MLLVGGEFLFAQVQEYFRGQKRLCQFCANLNYIPVKGDTTAIAIFGGTRVQPGNLPTEVHTLPVKMQDF